MMPKLAPHVRLRFDATRNRSVLLGPESVAVLNQTSAAGKWPWMVSR